DVDRGSHEEGDALAVARCEAARHERWQVAGVVVTTRRHAPGDRAPLGSGPLEPLVERRDERLALVLSRRQTPLQPDERVLRLIDRRGIATTLAQRERELVERVAEVRERAARLTADRRHAHGGLLPRRARPAP